MEIKLNMALSGRRMIIAYRVAAWAVVVCLLIFGAVIAINFLPKNIEYYDEYAQLCMELVIFVTMALIAIGVYDVGRLSSRLHHSPQARVQYRRLLRYRSPITYIILSIGIPLIALTIRSFVTEEDEGAFASFFILYRVVPSYGLVYAYSALSFLLSDMIHSHRMRVVLYNLGVFGLLLASVYIIVE